MSLKPQGRVAHANPTPLTTRPAKVRSSLPRFFYDSDLCKTAFCCCESANGAVPERIWGLISAHDRLVAEFIAVFATVSDFVMLVMDDKPQSERRQREEALSALCVGKCKEMDLTNHRTAWNALRGLPQPHKDNLVRMGYGSWPCAPLM